MEEAQADKRMMQDERESLLQKLEALGDQVQKQAQEENRGLEYQCRQL